jgi:hypothetical protein
MLPRIPVCETVESVPKSMATSFFSWSTLAVVFNKKKFESGHQINASKAFACCTFIETPCTAINFFFKKFHLISLFISSKESLSVPSPIWIT